MIDYVHADDEQLSTDNRLTFNMILLLPETIIIMLVRFDSSNKYLYQYLHTSFGNFVQSKSNLRYEHHCHSSASRSIPNRPVEFIRIVQWSLKFFKG